MFFVYNMNVFEWSYDDDIFVGSYCIEICNGDGSELLCNYVMENVVVGESCFIKKCYGKKINGKR